MRSLREIAQEIREEWYPKVQMSTYYKVYTPLGYVWVLPQGKDPQGGYQLHVDLSPRPDTYGYEYPDTETDDFNNRMCVRGIRITGSFHVYEWADTLYRPCMEWDRDSRGIMIEPRRQVSGWALIRNVFLRRDDKAFVDATEAMKKTVVAQVEVEVSKWARANRSILIASHKAQIKAEIEANISTIERRRNDIAKIESEMEALRQQIAELEATL